MLGPPGIAVNTNMPETS